MATRMQLADRRYKAAEKKWKLLVKKMSAKYGRNWTIYSLTKREAAYMHRLLQVQKEAIDYVIKNDPTIKRIR